LDYAGDDTKNHKPVGGCEGKRKEKEKGGRGRWREKNFVSPDIKGRKRQGEI
jgi:hypothetical protein